MQTQRKLTQSGHFIGYPARDPKSDFAARWNNHRRSWCNSGVIVHRLSGISRDNHSRVTESRTTSNGLFMGLNGRRWH
jgi:hypothetical protein